MMNWDEIVKQRQQAGASNAPAYQQDPYSQLSEWDRLAITRGADPAAYLPQQVVPTAPTTPQPVVPTPITPARTDSIAGADASVYYDYAQQLKQQAATLQSEQPLDVPTGRAKLTASLADIKAQTRYEAEQEQKAGLTAEAKRIEQIATMPSQQYYETKARDASRRAEDYLMTDPERSAKYDFEAALYESALPKKELTPEQRKAAEAAAAKAEKLKPSITEPTTYKVSIVDSHGMTTTARKTIDPDDWQRIDAMTREQAAVELDKIIQDKAYKMLQEKQLKYAKELTEDETALFLLLEQQRLALQSRADDYSDEYLRRAQNDTNFEALAEKGAKDKDNPLTSQAAKDYVGEASISLVNRYATRTEKKLVDYYYGISKDEGDKYLSYVAGEAVMRNAERIGTTTKGLLPNLGLAASAGLERFFAGIAAPIAAVGGYDMKTPVSYANQLNMQRLKNEGKSTVGLELMTTVLNQIPSILIGRVAGSAAAGSVAMGTSAGGNAMYQAINEGYDPYSAAMYGVVIGLSETMLERVLGGIDAFGGFASTTFGKATLDKVESLANAIAKRPKLQTLLGSLISHVGAAAPEFVEEALQSIMEPAFRRYILQDMDDRVNWDEVFYEGVLGFYSALILNATMSGGAKNTVLNIMATPRTQAEVSTFVANVNQQIDALNEALLVLPTDTKVEPLKPNASYDQARRKQAEVFMTFADLSISDKSMLDLMQESSKPYQKPLKELVTELDNAQEKAEAAGTEQGELFAAWDFTGELEAMKATSPEHSDVVDGFLGAMASDTAPTTTVFNDAVKKYAQQTLFDLEQSAQAESTTATESPAVAPQSTHVQDNASPISILPQTETQAESVLEPSASVPVETQAAVPVETQVTEPVMEATPPTRKRRRTKAEIIADQKKQMSEIRKEAREAVKQTKEAAELARREAVEKQKEISARKISKLTEQHLQKRSEFEQRYEQLRDDSAYLKAETKLTMGKARADIKSARQFAANLLTEIDSRYSQVQMERFVRELYKLAHAENVNWGELQKSAEAMAFAALESTAASQDVDVHAATAEILGNKILADVLYIEPAQPTFADIKYAEKTEALAEMRTRYENKISQLKTTQAERAARSKLQAKITSNINKMATLLKKRSDKQHVPHGLEGEVNAFLASIDRRTTRQGEKTHDKLLALTDKYLASISQVNPEFYDADLKDALDSFYTLAEAGTPLAQMTNEQLQVVANAAAFLNHAISNANKAFAKQSKENIDSLIDDAWSDVNYVEQKKGRMKRESSNALSRLLNDHQVSPFDKFKEWGKTLETMFWSTYNEGQKKYVFRLREAIEAFHEITKDINMDSLTGDKVKPVTVELSWGDYIMTPGQIMYIYVTANQPEGLNALLNGGLRLRQQFVKRQGRTVPITPLYHDTISLTQSDLDLLTSSKYLTETMKRFADDVVAKLSPLTAGWGNETSLQVYGYEKFNVNNYFRLDVDAPTTDPTKQEQQQRPTLAGWSSAKTRNTDGHNFAMNGVDFFTTLYQSIERMAKYSSLLPYTLDLRRVMRHPAFKNHFESVFGKNSTAYFNTMIADIEKSSGKLTPEHGSEIAEKLIRNVKSAVIPANISVLAKQYTAYVRAAALVDPQYLSQALLMPSPDWEMVKQHSQEAQWKDWGYFELGFGRSLEQLMLGKEGIQDKLMGAISKADTQTWGKIWSALELETAAKTDLEKGSEAFYNHVTNKFAKVIAETQVIDTVFHRSQAQRTDSTYMRMVSAFMSEPFKDYNLIRTSWREYKIHGTKEARNKAIRATAASVSQNLVVSMVGSLFDWFRSKKPTDEYELEDWLSSLGMEMIDNVFGMFLHVKQIWSLYRGFSTTGMDMKAVEAAANALKTTYDMIANGKGTPFNAFKKTLEAASYALGVPLATIERDLEAFYRKTLQLSGSSITEYGYAKALYDIDSTGNASKFYDLLYRAYAKGDQEAYDFMVDDLLQHGYQMQNIKSALEQRSKKNHGDITKRVIIRETEADYIAGSKANDNYAASWLESIPEKQQSSFHNKRGQISYQVTNKLMNTNYYKAQEPNVQVELIRKGFDYASDLARQTTTNEQMTGWRLKALRATQEHNVPVHMFIIAERLKTTTDSQDAWKQALQRNGFTSKQISAIMAMK